MKTRFKTKQNVRIIKLLQSPLEGCWEDHNSRKLCFSCAIEPTLLYSSLFGRCPGATGIQKTWQKWDAETTAGYERGWTVASALMVAPRLKPSCPKWSLMLLLRLCLMLPVAPLAGYTTAGTASHRWATVPECGCWQGQTLLTKQPHTSRTLRTGICSSSRQPEVGPAAPVTSDSSAKPCSLLPPRDSPPALSSPSLYLISHEGHLSVI